jgi:hypothetical protein
MDTVPTKESCIQEYKNLKAINGDRAPKRDEFLQAKALNKRTLDLLFGSASYSKLQQAAGDTPNRLLLERTPMREIMEQYALLVVDYGSVPPCSEWVCRGLKPTESGLAKSHHIKWSEMPARFLDWVKKDGDANFQDAVAILSRSMLPVNGVLQMKPGGDSGRNRLVKDIHAWIPDRRRNVEETYKVELKKYLEAKSYKLTEESGDSLCDLVVNKTYVIELKKEPDSAEYDRLFGQVARHLQFYKTVLVVICDAKRGDRYNLFLSLVDKFLNVEPYTVEVIRI